MEPLAEPAKSESPCEVQEDDEEGEEEEEEEKQKTRSGPGRPPTPTSGLHPYPDADPEEPICRFRALTGPEPGRC